MRYALVPHAGDWREAGVFRDGLELNHPLLCRKVLPHPGSLPARWGLLDVSNPNVVVSSLKPSRGGDVALQGLRGGRPARRGRDGQAAGQVARAAREANLLEDAGGAVSEDRGRRRAVSICIRSRSKRCALRLGAPLRRAGGLPFLREYRRRRVAFPRSRAGRSGSRGTVGHGRVVPQRRDLDARPGTGVLLPPRPRDVSDLQGADPAQDLDQCGPLACAGIIVTHARIRGRRPLSPRAVLSSVQGSSTASWAASDPSWPCCTRRQP